MSRYRSQIREVINRNVVVNLALGQGFNSFLPVYDGCADFIREDTQERLMDRHRRLFQDAPLGGPDHPVQAV